MGGGTVRPTASGTMHGLSCLHCNRSAQVHFARVYQPALCLECLQANIHQA